MKFYLASGFHQREFLRTLAAKLQGEGHEVCSNWIWINERPERDEPGWKTFASKIAHQNMIDLYRSDALIIDAHGVSTDNNGGSHSELGFMLARGRPVILIGELTNTFSYASDVVRVKSYDEALKIIRDNEIPLGVRITI